MLGPIPFALAFLRYKTSLLGEAARPQTLLLFAHKLFKLGHTYHVILQHHQLCNYCIMMRRGQ